MASRSSKNVIYSKGKSTGVMPKIKGFFKGIIKNYQDSHKKKQEMINKHGTSAIFK